MPSIPKSSRFLRVKQSREQHLDQARRKAAYAAANHADNRAQRYGKLAKRNADLTLKLRDDPSNLELVRQLEHVRCELYQLATAKKREHFDRLWQIEHERRIARLKEEGCDNDSV